MNPSSRYLTPCRSFGLRRVQKKTPGSGVSAAKGVNAPFTSPCASWKGTAESAQKSPSPLVTPLIRKSLLKMGLSKPSKKQLPSATRDVILKAAERPDPVTSSDSCEKRIENGFLGWDFDNDEERKILQAKSDLLHANYHKLVSRRTDVTGSPEVVSSSEGDALLSNAETEQIQPETSENELVTGSVCVAESSPMANRKCHNSEVSFPARLEVNDTNRNNALTSNAETTNQENSDSLNSLGCITKDTDLSATKESEADPSDSLLTFPENPKTYVREVTKILKCKPAVNYSKQRSLQPLRPKESLQLSTTSQRNDTTDRGYSELNSSESWSEIEEFKKLNDDVQKWLAGGQRAIGDILEEVRRLKGKNLTVMQLLDDLGVNPTTVGYDRNLEEFVSLKKFLLSHNALL